MRDRIIIVCEDLPRGPIESFASGERSVGDDLSLDSQVVGLASIEGANFVAKANPLADEGSARCSSQFATGPLPVTRAWVYIPSIDSMARRPFLISFVWSSESASGSSEKPRGSKEAPG